MNEKCIQSPICNQLDTENYIKRTSFAGAQSSNRTKLNYSNVTKKETTPSISI